MPPRNAHGAPRSVVGGRSDRYESRRRARRVARAYAPEWGDASAVAVLQLLKDQSAVAGLGLGLYTASVMGEPRGFEGILRCLRSRLHAREIALAADIMGRCAGDVQSILGERLAVARRVHTFLKPLRERCRIRTRWASSLWLREILLLGPSTSG